MSTQPSPPLSAVFDGSGTIADARHAARSFLDDLRDVHGLAVSARSADTVELVVSELVTNARKYAPGPHRLTLAVHGGSVTVSVWDTSPTTPTIPPPDPYRVGRHGLEIVMGAAQGFQVHHEGQGKRITVTIALADDPPGGCAK
ncbi:ATP-binding protein [Streptomyces sp. NPDC059917]|uniref:ATP-binding protein n=1 Tax=Streptomyces sp. NPDC059917 TaxID=3347002 RepID=UPI00364725C9